MFPPVVAGALALFFLTVASQAQVWSGESALGGSAKQVIVGRNASGRLEVFYVGTNDALCHKWQLAPH